MQITVYQTRLQPATLIATPGTRGPSAESEQKHGPLRFVGTIEIDEALLPAITQAGPATTVGADWVIEEKYGARYVNALLKRSRKPEHRVRLFVAPAHGDARRV